VTLCFLAATVFWFFNALNKNYATNVRFPLQFEFDAKKYVPARPLPRDVYVNVSGSGWDLLRKNITVKLPPLIIPLERPAETKKIVGITLPPLLASQLGNLKINHIVTDTLYLAIEPKDSMKVKVVIDPRAVTFKSGYGRISPIVVLPDSVQLEGPKSVLQRVADTIVVKLPEKKLSYDFREQIEAKLPEDELIRRKPPQVEVMFEVGEVTDVKQQVKLELVNIPTAARIMKEKDSIHCVVQIPKSRVDDFEQLAPSVKAVIDLKEARSGGRKMLPVVRGLPPYATLVRVDSVRLKLY
jgi:hypothetical protein